MLRYIAPSNAVSYLSLAASLLAVHFAAEGMFHLTAALWALSALLDNFDGAFASLFERDELQKEFGKELDSLIDCVAFGVVPVVCLRLLAFPRAPAARVAFAAAALLWVLAAVTRLGVFDIMDRRGERGFLGLPTTEAALLLSTVLLFPFPRDLAWTVLVVLAALMVAPARIGRPGAAARVLLTAWLVGVVGAHLAMHLAAR
jgi:CDP-diacylglycerol---serine O-phosphatidyltransferase